MKAKWFTILLAAGGLSFSGFGALAQTARIAYLSHGGSLAAPAEGESVDNFGLPTARFIADTIVATSDTTAVVHGRMSRWEGSGEGARTTRTINYGKHVYQQATATGPQSRGTAVRVLQQRYPSAKLVGFDTLAKPTAPAMPPLKQQKTKRKRPEGAALPMLPPAGPPQHPGVWLALGAIIGLGGAGLLLHEKPLPMFKSVA